MHRSRTATAGSCEAAHPDPAVVLPDAGDHVEVARSSAGRQSWTRVPASSYAWTRTVRFGFGCSRSGILVTSRRSQSGPRWSRSTSGSRRAGDGHPDQAVAPPARCCRGSRAGPRTRKSRSPARSPVEPVADDGAGAGLGDRDERLVRRQRDPVGEREPVEHDLDRAVGVAPEQPAGARCPGRSRPSTGRCRSCVDESLNQIVPSRGDRGVVAEQHRRAVDRSASGLDAPVGGSHAGAGRGAASQTRRRPSRSSSMPSGRPPVWATRSMLAARRGRCGRCCRPRCR